MIYNNIILLKSIKMKEIVEPSVCPCCGSSLIKINDQLFCRNSSCSAQLFKKLEHFAKTLGIKGLGPKTIQKLDINNITELFFLSESDLLTALGSEKLSKKLFIEIQNAKNTSLDLVLQSFSIPLIGGTASKKLAEKVKSIDEITVSLCKEAGLGDKATNNLITWLNTEYLEIKEFLPFKFTKVDKFNYDLPTVCITGKLKSFKTKAEAEKALNDNGFVVVDSVTKTLNILIDETDKISEKRKKAEQYGITIVTNIKELINE